MCLEYKKDILLKLLCRLQSSSWCLPLNDYGELMKEFGLHNLNVETGHICGRQGEKVITKI